MSKLKILLTKSGFVWGDVNFYEVTFNLVAKMVSLFLIKCNNEVLEAVRVGLEGFFWLEKLNGIWHGTRENRRGMLA